jgi:hypothetical protein
MKNNNQRDQGKSNNNKSTVADNPPTIPLKVAIERAEAWRTLLSNLHDSPIAGTVQGSVSSHKRLIPSQLLFRAINIRMEDIDYLKMQHPDAHSIRLYMSIPDPDFPFQICGMLVPVDAQNKDMLTLASSENVTEAEMMNDATNSTVYDFTQPCPSMCNTSSPLFDGNVSVIPYLRYKK